jgi:hypothetical protein
MYCSSVISSFLGDVTVQSETIPIEDTATAYSRLQMSPYLYRVCSFKETTCEK